MYLNEDLHNKLVEDFKLIIDYLEENVASKIVNKCEFQIKNFDIGIYPIKSQKKHWFKIKENDYYFTIKEYADIFYAEDTSVSYDLFDGINDEVLYEFIYNWEFIKERCNVCLKSAKDVEDHINNFNI